MKMTSTIRTGMVAAAAAAVLMASPLSAQQKSRDVPLRAGAATAQPDVAARFSTEMGQQAVTYWTDKLNRYRVKIDAALPANDLAELNKLRARWGVLVGEMTRLRNAEATSTDKASGTDASDDQGDITLNIDENELMGKVTEVMDIYTSVKDLAARNASPLGGIRETVGFDLATFLGNVVDRTRLYRQEHRAEIEASQSELPDFTINGAGSSEEVMKEYHSEKGQKQFREVYGFGIEPLVLLYNGMDLQQLLAGAGPMAKPIAGLALPEGAVLKQNFPNPASSRTTISYNLPETSDHTTLRLFDASGAMVASNDLGSQSAGEHSSVIDLSSLANGSYLYQLTIQTSHGEQVYAKGLQVVK